MTKEQTYEISRRNKLKARVFELLGDRCASCGFSDQRALQIDHVNGDGYQDRLIRKMWSLKLYRAIVKGQVALSDYQVLCANCNWIKRSKNGEVRGPNILYRKSVEKLTIAD